MSETVWLSTTDRAGHRSSRPYRFAGRNAQMVKALLYCHDPRIGLNRIELSREIWGLSDDVGQPLDQVVYQIRTICPGLIQLYVTKRYRLDPDRQAQEAPPPENTPDLPVQGYNPRRKPEMVIEVEGRNHEIRGAQQPALLRIMLKQRDTFTDVTDLLVQMGLPTHKRRAVDNAIVSLRTLVRPDLFQTGGYGKGWRLNPHLKIRVRYDSARRPEPENVT